ALWDMLPDGKRIGGAPANFAYHVSRFGIRSCIISGIGDDALGQELIDNYKWKGIDCIAEVLPYPTGTVQVGITDAGIPHYEITDGVAWDNIPYTDRLAAIAKNTKAVCFGTLAQRNVVSRATISRFIDTIPTENEPLIIFDVNFRQNFYDRNILISSLNRCNVLKINDEELAEIRKMLNLPDVGDRDICRGLISSYNLGILILTCGVNGSYVYTSSAEESYMPTPEVSVADTVGAGDSFTATFIANILKGKTIEESHKRAVEVSAYVCTRIGAMPLLPSEYTADV
ncbi:MAG: carbohydrate kinase, partial [Muribaculaceae bacterium]|nr:carbohydrate kinase [Muribaculaceae bacterium]